MIWASPTHDGDAQIAMQVQGKRPISFQGSGTNQCSPHTKTTLASTSEARVLRGFSPPQLALKEPLCNAAGGGSSVQILPCDL